MKWRFPLFRGLSPTLAAQQSAPDVNRPRKMCVVSPARLQQVFYDCRPKREVFRKLVANADIMVENYRPGAMKALVETA
jgi:hypothetical protein